MTATGRAPFFARAATLTVPLLRCRRSRCACLLDVPFTWQGPYCSTRCAAIGRADLAERAAGPHPVIVTVTTVEHQALDELADPWTSSASWGNGDATGPGWLGRALDWLVL
ncbi:hypothetical protein [Amycolatopsis sp. H20-H5]|uniref:hypothetical protein n=1 Tax=Amycolatopsis sp. H20-H5 TaxID=3046309 RepID=UPI002DBAFDF2|nr:hypothetical protein [Amycolatopsis sp. H20-H5]MEC3977881.1 hypothetical protein [Amycolatopsis sp. H20-H5]